jgi:SH3 domain-containing YSC84-like protein 1
MIVMNDDGMHNLLSSKFKIGADASAARSRFAGVDLNVAALTQDKDETRILYGKFFPFDQILEGRAPLTNKGRPFLAALAHYTGPNSSEPRTSAAKEQR